VSSELRPITFNSFFQEPIQWSPSIPILLFSQDPQTFQRTVLDQTSSGGPQFKASFKLNPVKQIAISGQCATLETSFVSLMVPSFIVSGCLWFFTLSSQPLLLPSIGFMTVVSSSHRLQLMCRSSGTSYEYSSYPEHCSRTFTRLLKFYFLR